MPNDHWIASGKLLGTAPRIQIPDGPMFLFAGCDKKKICELRRQQLRAKTWQYPSLFPEIPVLFTSLKLEGALEI
jgi:hypothetical protein